MLCRKDFLLFSYVLYLGANGASDTQKAVNGKSIFNGVNVEDILNFKVIPGNYCKEEHYRKGNFTSPKRRMSENASITSGLRGIYNTSLIAANYVGALGWRSTSNENEWEFKCGASLISERFMLTAAHCTYVSARDGSVAKHEPEIVKLGDKFLIDPKYVRISRIIKHENYRAPKVYFDIALLELAETVDIGPLIRPACLWSSSDTSSLGTLSVTGWGVVDIVSQKATTELQVADVNLIDDNLCNEKLNGKRNRNWRGLVDHQICAGHLAGGIDTCQGDSGGPLQAKINLTQSWDMYYLVGVMSFGFGCARRDVPSVYTETASFIDWIESIVWPDS